MKAIYKYVLSNEERETIEMPAYSTILRVGVQGGKVTIWAIVETDKPMVKRTFCIFGTGWEFTLQNYEYLDTVFVGSYVWHVFENLIQ